MRHWTKDKGDMGLGFVIADLISKGIQVALPISEHLPFDLIAISEGNELETVSVKYRTLDGFRDISMSFRSTYADSFGSHVRKHDKTSYDSVAIYCPDTKLCYYMNVSDFKDNTFVYLRITPTINRQVKNIRM